MRLSKARIQNFRSIVDSEVVNIERDVTALVGKNETGKSNFLNALQSYNADYKYLQSDMPKHLAEKLESVDPDELPIVSLWFSLEHQNRIALSKAIKNASKIENIRSTRFYSGAYRYWPVGKKGDESEFEPLPPPRLDATIKQLGELFDQLSPILQKHGERVAKLASPMSDAIATMAEIHDRNFSGTDELIGYLESIDSHLQGMPEQDRAIKSDIKKISEILDDYKNTLHDQQPKDVEDVLENIIPKFILHNTRVDFVPDEVVVEQFLSDPDDYSKGMANLCRAVDLTFEKLQEVVGQDEIIQRQRYEDIYKSKISGPINRFWKQQKYYVHFRFDGGKLAISITDQRDPTRMAPSERSDGFQWLLSFYAKLISDQGDGIPSIVLLDNPAVDLHIDGQRDIMKFLENDISKKSQVIYVTHSPGMIDAFGLERVRKIFMEGQKGTKIAHLFQKVASKGDSDILEPVRLAIGASMISSLVASHHNILVEGPTDKTIMETIFDKEKDSVAINGPLSCGPAIASFYQTNQLPFIAVVDADSSGRAIKKGLKEVGINEENIIDLRKIFSQFGQRDFEIEDIINGDLYYQAVKEEYSEIQVTKPAVKEKITKAYSEQFNNIEPGYTFSKRRVAERIKHLILDGKIDQETRDNFEKFKHFINEYFS